MNFILQSEDAFSFSSGMGVGLSTPIVALARSSVVRMFDIAVCVVGICGSCWNQPSVSFLHENLKPLGLSSVGQTEEQGRGVFCP